MTSRIRGGDELRKKLQNIPKKLLKPITNALDIAALQAATEAKRLVAKGPKSGILYQKYVPRRVHRASAPGQPPATDTGRLVASIRHRVQEGGLVAEAFSDVAYAPHLEFGTRTMRKRPFLKPAFVKTRKRNLKNIANAVARVTKGL